MLAQDVVNIMKVTSLVRERYKYYDRGDNYEQKEASRKHPWVLPRKVAYLV